MREDPPEGVLDALREAGPHERPGERRPAEGVVAGQVQRLDLRVDREPDLAQPVDGRDEPGPPARPLRREGRLERLVRRVHPDPQDVQLALEQVEVQAAGHRVDLHGRDEHEVRRERRGAGAVSSRYAARLSWSAIANSRTPAS